MPNSWFQFKEFRVEQGRSAMKVCSDSCLFGAIVSEFEAARISRPSRILDPGCGTGLLSLMMAQRIPDALVTAVDLHPGSVQDCRLNFNHSPWYERLELIESDFKELVGSRWQHAFDCIVCNPPFFVSQLPSPDPARTSAMHLSSEEIQYWIKKLAEMLNPNGRFWMLSAPMSQHSIEKALPDAALSISRKILLMREPGVVWRQIYCFGFGNTGFQEESWVVQDEKGRPLSLAKELLMSFYRA